jgi:tetratricopeptide (TPR) repeat protein
MELSLASGSRRNYLLVGSALFAVLLVYQASELWLANRWINSGDLKLVQRGAQLISSDGSGWDNLGHLRQWSLSDSDLPGAIKDYRTALRENPRSAHYWMDLASAYEASGDDAAANDAFKHAEAVYPDSAEVAFYFGNFLLRQQQYASAFLELRRAVREDPSLLPLAISRAWQATNDADQITDQLLPPTMYSYLQAIDYFAAIHQCDAALAVWNRLAEFKTAVPLARTFPLFDELISENRSADARRLWLQVASDTGASNDSIGEKSLVWNGDFGRDITGGGLGWRWERLSGVYLSFEAAPPQGGVRSLRLDFNGGSNVELSGPYEYVAVTPENDYHFHALMRTDAITTESGLRFSISDPNHRGAVSVLTENMTGTHGWTPVDADFKTGPATNFIVIRLVRSPSLLFDNKLSGTVWIADVSLTAVNAGAEPHQ